jgi:hypothetical protein
VISANEKGKGGMVFLAMPLVFALIKREITSHTEEKLSLVTLKSKST